jgi:tetratricopeptide (TPR) repeat protein
MNALATMADQSADQGGLYRYLRANIAIDHCRYGQALRDLNYVKSNGLYSSHALYYNLAKCYLELARFDEALLAADQALNRDPSQPEYYLVKALAEYHVGEGGHFDAAMEALNRCSAVAPQYVPMLIAKASLLSSVGKDKDALGYLNAAVANEPGNAEALMARAAVLKRLNYLQLVMKDYNMITRLSDDVYDLKGFGLNELGRDSDALRWLQSITSSNLPGGENFYYAALFMAQRGDNFKAMEYLQKAVDLGYGSRYRMEIDELSPVNLKALRAEPGFDLLMDKAQRNFVERF